MSSRNRKCFEQIQNPTLPIISSAKEVFNKVYSNISTIKNEENINKKNKIESHDKKNKKLKESMLRSKETESENEQKQNISDFSEVQMILKNENELMMKKLNNSTNKNSNFFIFY